MPTSHHSHSSARQVRPSPSRLPDHESTVHLTASVRMLIMLGLTTPRPIPRKEVIQPQFPLRLPCYDFVPITHPTLDGCPPEGLAHRLQVLPAFVT